MSTNAAIYMFEMVAFVALVIIATISHRKTQREIRELKRLLEHAPTAERIDEYETWHNGKRSTGDGLENVE